MLGIINFIETVVIVTGFICLVSCFAILKFNK